MLCVFFAFTRTTFSRLPIHAWCLLGLKAAQDCTGQGVNALPCDDFTRRWESPDVENEILGKQKDFATYLAKPCFSVGSRLLNPAPSFSQSPHDRVNEAE
jgi:hypothetical protein